VEVNQEKELKMLALQGWVLVMYRCKLVCVRLG